MKQPPHIKLKVIEPAPDAKPFIKTERNLCSLQYPLPENESNLAQGQNMREMVIDSVVRYQPDASVIIPWTMKYRDGGNRMEREAHVWLRSSIRPAAAVRFNNDPLFSHNGNLWELPAGIIDKGETPQEAAQRECKEEAGFDCDVEEFKYLSTMLSMPALMAEQLFFYAVEVDNDLQREPTLDGSPLEEGAELWCVPLDDALQMANSGKLPDMKTNLGLRFLVNHIG